MRTTEHMLTDTEVVAALEASPWERARAASERQSARLRASTKLAAARELVRPLIESHRAR